MTETTVAYHRDGFGPDRPAINVKAGLIWGDPAYQPTYDRLAANPSIGESRTDALAEFAYEAVCFGFWTQAEIEARRLGLGEITQEGRSGGWLVLTDGYDPDEDYPDGDTDADLAYSAERQQRWLAAYRELTDWCEARIAAVPADMAAILEELATEEAVAP